MCFLFTIYDGPSYTPRKLTPEALKSLDVSIWSEKGPEEPLNKATLFVRKWNSVIFCKERVFGDVAPYFEVFKDCLRQIHKLLFEPNIYGSGPSSMDREYGGKKATLTKQYKRFKKNNSAKLGQVMQAINSELRIWDRPPDVLFDSFLEALNGTIEELSRRDAALADFTATQLGIGIGAPSIAPADENPEVKLQSEDVNVAEAKSPSKESSPPARCNARKRRVTEKKEVGHSRRKRTKSAPGAPFHPSAAANVRSYGKN